MRTRAFKDKIESLITDLLKSHNATLFTKVDNEKHRYIRAILPQKIIVSPNDQINYGVALKIYKKNKIEIGPYLYRIVCENGVFISHERYSREITVDGLADFEIKSQILEAMEKCCSRNAFNYTRKYILESLQTPANLRLIFHRLSHFTQWSQRTSVYNHIIRRMDTLDQPTKYDLMNAITSLARDTIDPDLKWNLQKLGWDAVIGLDSAWFDIKHNAPLEKIAVIETNSKTTG